MRTFKHARTYTHTHTHTHTDALVRNIHAIKSSCHHQFFFFSTLKNKAIFRAICQGIISLSSLYQLNIINHPNPQYKEDNCHELIRILHSFLSEASYIYIYIYIYMLTKITFNTFVPWVR